MAMFSEIDQLTREDHYYLSENDECYFYGDYTPRESFEYSVTNSFILNLKKSVDRRGTPEWRYKEKAIAKASRLIREGFKDEWLELATLVPVPPSKVATNPAYDDRMIQILNNIYPNKNLDIRELVQQLIDREAMHQLEDRYTPSELISMWQINEGLAMSAPTSIGVFDDVLTSGTHFRAIKTILQNRFPGVEVVGIFLARVVRPSENIDLSELFGLSEP